MAVPLVDHLDRIAAAILDAPRLLICCDFDGTLVQIRDRPEQCSLDPAVGRALSELTQCEGVHVGIVSGRELTDLRDRVRVEGLAYAGNHGLEIDTPEIAFRHPTALAARSELKRIIDDLRDALNHIAGVWVEDKGVSASIHFRQAVPSRVPQALETIERVAEEMVGSGAFVFRTGKAVLEGRPAVDWNKGSAILWLAGQLFPAEVEPLIVYVGDDNTDEDAFCVLGTGIGVSVGDRCPTAAAYHVPDYLAVKRLVDWFVVMAREREKIGRTRRCS